MTDYVRNLWYFAAWEEEVPDGGFLARTLLDKPWLVVRNGDGTYSVLRDRCPHRFVALSKGRREGDTIHCAYHGLGWDTKSGQCAHNPYGGDTPPGAKVEDMPAVAAHTGVWFWPGDREKADPALIPDMAFLNDDGHVRGRFGFNVDYRLIVDNLMDLSHAEFIHKDTFGANGGLLDFGEQDVITHDDGSISNNWDIRGAEPPFFVADHLPDGGRIDQEIHIRWHAPATMALHVTMTRSGTRGEEIMPRQYNPHILTRKPQPALTTSSPTAPTKVRAK